MSHREDAPAYELRDLHGASRAVAYLTLAASPYVFVTSYLVPGISALTLGAAVLISLCMGVMGVLSWRRPAMLPKVVWFLAPIAATMVVAGLNFATHDASTGAQLFYLWPILYAANFLSRRGMYLNLLLVSLASLGVTLARRDPAPAPVPPA